MKQNKQTKSATSTKKAKVTKDIAVEETPISDVLTYRTAEDVKTALLVVSLVINVFILIGWITLQVTHQYDAQIATFLFVR